MPINIKIHLSLYLMLRRPHGVMTVNRSEWGMEYKEQER
jgi:hypothetical protein